MNLCACIKLEINEFDINKDKARRICRYFSHGLPIPQHEDISI